MMFASFRFRFAAVPAILAIVLGSGCYSSRPMHVRSNAFDFLYPGGSAEAQPAEEVDLKLPARVGLAFAPAGRWDPFSEVQKQRLLERIADEFRESEFVQSIEVVPSHYLAPGGGFEELNRLSAAFGVDVMTLVSIDQRQFRETTNKSWTYLTVLGAFVVKGETNDTRTLMDAVVYDIGSRTLLFRAAGESTLSGKSTPMAVDRRAREASEEGLELAADALIDQLAVALEQFREQVKTGTVRGAGTPTITVTSTSTATGEGGFGAGAVGPFLLLATGWLLAVAARRERR